jgi:hypothetical protein
MAQEEFARLGPSAGLLGTLEPDPPGAVFDLVNRTGLAFNQAGDAAHAAAPRNFGSTSPPSCSPSEVLPWPRPSRFAHLDR